MNWSDHCKVLNTSPRAGTQVNEVMDIFSFSVQFQSVINFYLCRETTASLRLITMRRTGGEGGGELEASGEGRVGALSPDPCDCPIPTCPCFKFILLKVSCPVLALLLRLHHTPRSLV